MENLKFSKKDLIINLTENNIQVYGYRWVVLLLFFFVNAVIQILWISYAPVTSQAQIYYNVGDALLIDLFSLTFMIAYIPITFLASYLIDKYDFRVGASIGALIMGVFGFLRFLAGRDFFLALIFQLLIAIGQPFLLNSVTKLSANWFPETEKTTATGISLLSTYIGVALGSVLSPLLITGNDLTPMLLTFGILSLVSAFLFVVFAKDRPPTPPTSTEIEEKVFMFDGIKQLFSNKYFLVLFAVFFVGLGVFNTMETYTGKIISNSEQAGLLGMIIIVGGVFGTMIMSILSDKLNKRKSLMIISLLITSISLFVFSFMVDVVILLVLGFFFGFGLLGASPIALEYAVDATKPVPEASSNGILMMSGQIGGIIFIVAFEDLTLNGSYFPALIIQAILLLICTILAFFIKEYKIRKE
ncbi:MAG: MFS transporter [Candidatus Lokiarchaeota archaeon]|nr:MFS transporter [Candidatus Lokiarchaeota archaeon]MBD3199953.1 MFS transporter [Candidatus Lokiarchaeota archaeon]